MSDETALRREAKRLMRRRARALRASLPRSAVAVRSAAIARALLAHEAVSTASRVALFWPIEGNNEVDLGSVDASLRERAVVIAYPAVDAESDRMCFRVASPAELGERGKGFSEPAPESPEAPALDVIVVPGLMFDARGHRLGYGAGYYDRTLPRYRPGAVAMGVAFDFQLAADLPATDGDVAVDWIVTDERVMRCR